MEITLDLKPSQYLHLQECLTGTIEDCNEQLAEMCQKSCPNDPPSSNMEAVGRFKDNLTEVKIQLDVVGS